MLNINIDSIDINLYCISRFINSNNFIFYSKFFNKWYLMTSISKDDWILFVDTGEITDQLVYYIANKIKNNITLSKQEISIYTAHSHRIEQLLRKNNFLNKK